MTLTTILKDLGEKAATDAVDAITRTVELVEPKDQAGLYAACIISICAHLCWTAHKAGGGSYEDLVDLLTKDLKAAEKEYIQQEKERERPN